MQDHAESLLRQAMLLPTTERARLVAALLPSIEGSREESSVDNSDALPQEIRRRIERGAVADRDGIDVPNPAQHAEAALPDPAADGSRSRPGCADDLGLGDKATESGIGSSRVLLPNRSLAPRRSLRERLADLLLPLWSLVLLAVTFVVATVVGLVSDREGWFENRPFLTNMLSSLAAGAWGVPVVVIALDRVRRRRQRSIWWELHFEAVRKLGAAAADYAESALRTLEIAAGVEGQSADWNALAHLRKGGVMGDVWAAQYAAHTSVLPIRTPQLEPTTSALVNDSTARFAMVVEEVLIELAHSPEFDRVAPILYRLRGELRQVNSSLEEEISESLLRSVVSPTTALHYCAARACRLAGQACEMLGVERSPHR